MTIGTKWPGSGAILGLLLFLLPGWGDAPAPVPPGSPSEFFRRLQSAGKAGDMPVLEALLPAPLAEPLLGLGEKILLRDVKEVLEWRRSLGSLAASSMFVEERKTGDQGVVRFRTAPGEEHEFLFEGKAGSWSLASPVAYGVLGKSLSAVNGEGPVGARLAVLTDGTLGKRAFSFAHVSRNPLDCQSMDIWYCHNGDLHLSHPSQGARIARVSAKSISEVVGIPVGVAWRDHIAPEAGGVYVLRCRLTRSHDFFVKAIVTRVDEEMVVLEWEILGSGFGSPPSIRKVYPKNPLSGSPTRTNLCNKLPVRSTPEPAPEPPGKE